MIIYLQKPRFRSKVAFFDFDWTLVCPKNGNTFPKNAEDWKWLNPNIPDKLKEYYKKGYQIVIVTNQSKEWKKTMIENALSTLDIPITVCIGYTKETQKPFLTILENIFEGGKMEKIKKDKSFMCGDALGRSGDHSDCDKKFAEALGVRYYAPEDLFGFEDYFTMRNKNINKIKLNDKQEVVIMVGYPGSGKTKISDDIFGKSDKYEVLHGDDYKTAAAILNNAKNAIKKGKSVVIDATNPTKSKREVYIELAKINNIHSRCIYVDTPREIAYSINKKRDKPVPAIAYAVYNKQFEYPTTEEGCEVIVV